MARRACRVALPGVRRASRLTKTVLLMQSESRQQAPGRRTDAHVYADSKGSSGAPFLTRHSQTVLHLEHSGHLARTHFCNLPIRRAVDDSEQHRSAILDYAVDRLGPDRLHAREVQIVAQVLNHYEVVAV